MERVMVTMPSDLLQEIDERARRLGKKRSQVARQALREWLERQQQQEREALMAEGYQEMAQQASAVVSEGQALQSASVEGIWRWDE